MWSCFANRLDCPKNRNGNLSLELCIMHACMLVVGSTPPSWHSCKKLVWTGKPGARHCRVCLFSHSFLLKLGSSVPICSSSSPPPSSPAAFCSLQTARRQLLSACLKILHRLLNAAQASSPRPRSMKRHHAGGSTRAGHAPYQAPGQRNQQQQQRQVASPAAMAPAVAAPVTAPAVPPKSAHLTSTTFASLPLSPASQRALHEVLRFENLTEVQNETLPAVSQWGAGCCHPAVFAAREIPRFASTHACPCALCFYRSSTAAE